MKSVNKLTVTYHGHRVGMLGMTPDNRLCAFQYDKEWLANGFSISPLDLPLKPNLFIAKPQPFGGNFGIFEDRHWMYSLRNRTKMKIFYISTVAIQVVAVLNACITMPKVHGWLNSATFTTLKTWE